MLLETPMTQLALPIYNYNSRKNDSGWIKSIKVAKEH